MKTVAQVTEESYRSPQKCHIRVSQIRKDCHRLSSRATCFRHFIKTSLFQARVNDCGLVRRLLDKRRRDSNGLEVRGLGCLAQMRPWFQSQCCDLDQKGGEVFGLPHGQLSCNGHRDVAHLLLPTAKLSKRKQGHPRYGSLASSDWFINRLDGVWTETYGGG